MFPSLRVPLLTQPGLNWSVAIEKLPGAFDYFVLTMREGGEGGAKEALSRYLRGSLNILELLFFFYRWGISDGPSLDYSKETVSEDEETFILSLDCFTSDDSEEEDESLLL